MFSFSKSLMACAMVSLTIFQSADAHSKMTLPKPNSEISNSPSGTVDGPNTLTVPEGMSFGYGPEQNTAAFHKAFAAQTKYKTIRDLVMDKYTPDAGGNKECGFSAPTGPPQELPAMVEYEGGFDRSHEGPCEVWCDDVRVFYEENCAVKYTGKPAKLPYDKAKCAGAKRLQSIWLALHVPAWQAYVSCATLSGSGSGSGPAPSSAAPAPAPSSAAPGPAPAPTSIAPGPAPTQAPTKAPTQAPTQAPGPVPTPTKKNCPRKQRFRA